jgi:CRISPR-associated protein Cas1
MRDADERGATDSFRRMCRPDALRAAWQRVEESDGCAGIDGVTLARFAGRLEAELDRLRDELLSGAYRPLPLLRFAVPKDDGGERLLNVAAVRDRVAQHVVIGAVGPVLEAEFEACSFAYRRGRSVKEALREIERWRDAGYVWVVEADITAYFDHVDHKILWTRLGGLIGDERTLNLIRGWVAARVYDGRRLQTMRVGLPQGAPVSPLLANLYLDSFDEEVNAGGRKLVRFADDFLIMCKSRPKAEQALRLTRRLVDSLHLTLKEERTRVTNFTAGFKFLGAVFTHSFCLPQAGRHKEGEVRMPRRLTLLGELPRSSFNPAMRDALVRALKDAQDGEVLSCWTGEKTGRAVKAAVKDELTNVTTKSEPSQPAGDGAGGGVPAANVTTAATCAPPAETAVAEGDASPDGAASPFPPPALVSLRTLYVHEHGATLRCEQQRLEVVKDGEEVLSLPLHKIDQVVLFGNSQITTSAMKLCLRSGVPILLLSGGGRFLGSVESGGGQNIELQQKQFERRGDGAFALDVARRVVEGKIHNCRALLQRRGRSSASDARVPEAVAQMERMADALARASTLDEVRGYEGAASAAYFGGLAACVGSPFVFERRTRRPPLDPVNALLSFGYTLLLQNVYALVRARGLSPYVGYLHELRQGHPALCSDLIEELRAPVVDSLITSVINKRVFTLSDFCYEEAEEVEGGGAQAGAEGGRGCRLTDGARRRFIAQFERRMRAKVSHTGAGITTTWRGCIDLQVGHFVRVLRGEARHYLPMEIR